MSDPELTQFVHDALERGMDRAEIERHLVAAGWRRDKVSKALAGFADTDSPVPVPRPSPYLDAREAFLYLVLFSTLWVSAWCVADLLFDLVNRRFPDAAFQSVASLDSMRWNVASIVVAFPLFLGISTLLRRGRRRDPEKSASRIRKWLTYLTLFLAATAILSDVITLVFRLLGGELTTRFLLKVAIVATVAGTVFVYYLLDLRGEERQDGRGAEPVGGLGHLVFTALVVLGVSTSVVVGIRAIDSPSQARRETLDRLRVRQLSQIAGAIDGFWRQHGRLPGSLDELARDRTATVPSIDDPESGELYEYRPGESGSYQLCAEFDSRWEELEPPDRASTRFWSHPAGRHCFDIEVRVGRRD